MTVYRCCDDLRRLAVLAQKARNGIDYLEVVDHDEPDPDKRQHLLKVHFVRAGHPAVTAKNIRVEGGERIRGIAVTNAVFKGDVLEVTVDPRGDFSPYVLKLVGANGQPLATLDPQLAEVEFSFKVECASDFDCRPESQCRAPEVESPRIDYLAKDYESFRRLMLDRMALLVPRWRERNAADVGIALVELIAYVADRLSYEQDAVATEAYLGTARKRTSVRRHARLVDYRMHDGCNARTFVHVDVAANLTLPAHTPLYTKVDLFSDKRIRTTETEAVLAKLPTVFETLHAERLFAAHSKALNLYAWRSQNCCLPRGATRATLDGALPDLAPGQYLVFQEVIGPRTGETADADPTHRQVVRLTGANVGEDPVRVQPAVPIPITEIEWADDDALTFPLCVSATTDQAHGSTFKNNISIAFANVVLADHGQTMPVEKLGAVPAPWLFRPAPEGDACDRSEPVAVPPRFRPRLAKAPLTQQARIAAPSQDDPRPPAFERDAPAARVFSVTMDFVLPWIELEGALESGEKQPWDVRDDLFESEATSLHFTAEVEDDGIATIRFGDDEFGHTPVEKTLFTAKYRVGSGSAGNIGAGAIAHIVTDDGDVLGATNPMPARGGVDPETDDHARQSAPHAFRVQERAVTEADYAEVTEKRAGVDQAAATFRWTGSWYTLFNTVDRVGGLEVDDAYRADTRVYLERYRVIGNDLEVDAPRFVSIELAMLVCVKRSFFRSDVEAEVLEVLGNGVRHDGARGFFHPDKLTFGQSIYLSAIVGAVQSVEGVDSVTVTRFQRQGDERSSGVDTGELKVGALEIFRLENSRDFPERGKLELRMRGGR